MKENEDSYEYISTNNENISIRVPSANVDISQKRRKPSLKNNLFPSLTKDWSNKTTDRRKGMTKEEIIDYYCATGNVLL